MNKAGKEILRTLNNVNILASGNTTADGTTIMAGVFKRGSIKLGEGDNDVTLKSILCTKAAHTEIQLGGMTVAGAQKLTVLGKVNWLEYMGGKGVDTLNLNAKVSNALFDLGDGDNALSAVNAKGKGQILNNVSVTGGSGNDEVYYRSIKGTAAATGAGYNKIANVNLLKIV
jgi:hypothetical protein